MPAYKKISADSEFISLWNTVKKMMSHDIFFVTFKELSEYLPRSIDGKYINQIFLDKKYFSGVKAYNKLLLSKIFYKKFNSYENIMIAQLDALIIKSNVDNFLRYKYDYIGAPWVCNTTCKTNTVSYRGVGNGGLSIRRVESCIRHLNSIRRLNGYRLILKNHNFDCNHSYSARFFEKYLSYNRHPFFPNINEDLYWGIIASSVDSEWGVADVAVAKHFSFEEFPREQYRENGFKLPFGCHAWQRYDQNFWQRTLPANTFSGWRDSEFEYH